MRYVADASIAIVDWTPSPPPAWQTVHQSLSITAQGGSFVLAINGESLTTAHDDTFASGRFGLM